MVIGLEKLLGSKSISKNLKVQIHTTSIRPVVLYEAQRLFLVKRKILRRVFKPFNDDRTEHWRKIHNQELQDLFRRPNITKEILVRRLKWVGHAWKKQGSIIRTVIENDSVENDH